MKVAIPLAVPVALPREPLWAQTLASEGFLALVDATAAEHWSARVPVLWSTLQLALSPAPEKRPRLSALSAALTEVLQSLCADCSPLNWSPWREWGECKALSSLELGSSVDDVPSAPATSVISSDEVTLVCHFSFPPLPPPFVSLLLYCHFSNLALHERHGILCLFYHHIGQRFDLGEAVRPPSWSGCVDQEEGSCLHLLFLAISLRSDSHVRCFF